METRVHVLVVCHANVCRSRAAATILSAPLADLGAGVSGAGLDARVTDLPCPVTMNYLEQRSDAPVGAGATSSREEPDQPPTSDGVLATRIGLPPVRLTRAMVESADLILTATRELSSGVAGLSLASRPRTFTLMRAAASAAWVAWFVTSETLPPGAAPLPPAGDREARWAWLVGELDAARGQAPVLSSGPGAEVDDVPDPHAGETDHEITLRMIETACDLLLAAARVVLEAP